MTTRAALGAAWRRRAGHTRTLTGPGLANVVAELAVVAGLLLLAWPASLGGNVGLVSIAGRSMEPTHQLGDVVVTWRQEVEIGDIILFRVPKGAAGAGNPVIHRVVGGDESGWLTRGDNMPLPDSWRPTDADVLGVALFRIPLDGRLLTLLRSWWFVGVAGGMGVGLLLWPGPGPGRAQPRGRHRR